MREMREFTVKAYPYWICRACNDQGNDVPFVATDGDEICGYCNEPIDFNREPDTWGFHTEGFFDGEWYDHIWVDCNVGPFHAVDTK